jgi:hypothetical protein
MKTYKVYDCDVIGNAVDGYEVNDGYFNGTVEIEDDATPADVLRRLISAEYLAHYVTLDSVNIEIEDCSIDVKRLDGYTLYALRIDGPTFGQHPQPTQ